MSAPEAARDGRPALDGLRVVDLGHALAGPFAATMLGDFGADVLKVEHPRRGDAMRQLGPQKDGAPLWWKAAGRNKRSVALDFTSARGRELLLRLVAQSDVVVENFRPGTLERHGLGWEELSAANPRLVMLRISGYGQTGPDRTRPGFGRAAEAMSGAASLTGFPDRPPVHVGYSLADMLTGLMGAFGVLVAVVNRDRSGEGECIDLALYESLFRLIDWQVILHDQLGIVGERRGNGFPTALEGVVADVARSRDDVWLTYSTATDAAYVRLVALVFGEEALARPEFATLAARRRNAPLVEQATSAWIAERTAEDVERAFAEHAAVVSRVYDVEQLSADPTVRARGNIIEVPDGDAGVVRMHGVVPRLLRRPGSVTGTGPDLGEHTRAVLRELCGLDVGALDALAAEGVI